MSTKARFDGRVAFVTGGGSGIGAAVVRRLAAEGARVAIVDRQLDAAQQVAASLGAAALALPADVAVEAEVAGAVAQTLQHFGRLDIGVNAAGYGASAEVVDMDHAQWKGVIDVDLGGTFLCTKHEARAMLRAGGPGVVINIASVNAVRPGEGLAAYCAAKAGVVMLTEVAALELAPRGIRVLGVGPGVTHTAAMAGFLAVEASRKAYLDNVPAGRTASPDEVASLVAWLASDEAAYMNGETVYIDGGMRSRAYPSLNQRRPGGYPGPDFLTQLHVG